MEAGCRELSVLIVDDSPLMRSFIRRILTVSGVRTKDVLEAGDGQDALDLMDKSPVDLVLSDINMPRMNGSEMLKRMSATPSMRTIPVIVVSTDATRQRMDTMQQMGAQGYIRKPFQPEALRCEIERVLGV
ncbi:MAG: response regulator [Acidobacteria bacterium]|nr:response regulator [Acidobacteriota bacterium]